MKSQRRNVSEDPQTIRRRSSRLSATDALLLNIPIDLVIDIFSRLPLNSIARCRCVSKRWASVLRRPDFTELFLTKSLTRPQLLFARQKEDKKEVVFFSTPQQPQNLGENVSLVAVNHQVSFPVEDVFDISSSFNGYLCISHYQILEGIKTKELVSMICNPSTKQSFTLPKMKKTRKNILGMRSFLGYDPVEKQYKVLATKLAKSGVYHQVLTLGTRRNMKWRLVECVMPHFSPGRGCVCINGVLYYTAITFNLDDIIVCFDLRSEKYSFVKAVERGMPFATLINFQGKLASVRSSRPFVSSRPFEIWILEDPAEKPEWSKHIFNLPPLWKDAAEREHLYFVGVTDTNEFVFSSSFSSEPLHVYYYNFVNKAITRVEIQGMGAFEEASSVRLFLNHVENVTLM